MLGRYVGATLLILGLAMLMAPEAPDNGPAREVRAQAPPPVAPAEAPSSATRPVTISLADPAPAAPAAPADQAPLADVLEDAVEQTRADEEDAEPQETISTLVLALPEAGEEYVIPTLEQPSTVQEVALTSDTLALISSVETPAETNDETSEQTPAGPDGDSVSDDAAEDAPVLLSVTGSRVNVRSGPSTGFDVIASVSFGDSVEVVDDAGDGWAEIRLADGGTGYMARRFLGQ